MNVEVIVASMAAQGSGTYNVVNRKVVDVPEDSTTQFLVDVISDQLAVQLMDVEHLLTNKDFLLAAQSSGIKTVASLMSGKYLLQQDGIDVLFHVIDTEQVNLVPESGKNQIEIDVVSYNDQFFGFVPFKKKFILDTTKSEGSENTFSLIEAYKKIFESIGLFPSDTFTVNPINKAISAMGVTETYGGNLTPLVNYVQNILYTTRYDYLILSSDE